MIGLALEQLVSKYTTARAIGRTLIPLHNGGFSPSAHWPIDVGSY
jgi:hypothetical protein